MKRSRRPVREKETREKRRKTSTQQRTQALQEPETAGGETSDLPSTSLCEAAAGQTSSNISSTPAASSETQPAGLSCDEKEGPQSTPNLRDEDDTDSKKARHLLSEVSGSSPSASVPVSPVPRRFHSGPLEEGRRPPVVLIP